MKFACLKSSIGIIKAMLNIENFEISFLRDLISMTDISSDIKTVLLIHLSKKSNDGRLDWSGLKLENITPQASIHLHLTKTA